MNPHLFIFQAGIWLGEGEISFASSKETIHFYTRWQFIDKNQESYLWVQEVELHPLNEVNRNFYTFTPTSEKAFTIQLANESMGHVEGKGIISQDLIAWELRSQPESEGYDVYERQENGEYIFRSEYNSLDPYRTIIKGTLWKRSE